MVYTIDKSMQVVAFTLVILSLLLHFATAVPNCAGYCVNDECDSVTGACTNNCTGPYIPPACTEGCVAGTYGDNCANTCGHCANGTVCNSTSGECPSACEAGYTGAMCTEQSSGSGGALGSACTADGDCANITDAICDMSASEHTCKMGVGKACEADADCVHNANCVHHYCTCVTAEGLYCGTSEVGGAQSVSFAVTATVFVLPVLALMF